MTKLVRGRQLEVDTTLFLPPPDLQIGQNDRGHCDKQTCNLDSEEKQVESVRDDINRHGINRHGALLRRSSQGFCGALGQPITLGVLSGLGRSP